MILNILIILFLVAMIVWWSAQGLFSALLHLIFVILAGTIAFAFWEPVAHMMLSAPGSLLAASRMGMGAVAAAAFHRLAVHHAHGQRPARSRKRPHRTSHQPTARRTVWSARGHPRQRLHGHRAWLSRRAQFVSRAIKPYVVSANSGEVIENPEYGDLWLGVDNWTAAFYRRLSRGSLGSWKTPMATYSRTSPRRRRSSICATTPTPRPTAGPAGVGGHRCPDAAHQSSAELAGLPGPIVEKLGNKFKVNNNELVVIDTLWRPEHGTYDTDQTLRVPPRRCAC